MLEYSHFPVFQHVANSAGGLSYYNFIRKPASDFGWDWGPAFAPAGIYGMVEIQAYSHAIMTGVSLLPLLHLLCVRSCEQFEGIAGVRSLCMQLVAFGTACSRILHSLNP